jgi:hypothetical protein
MNSRYRASSAPTKFFLKKNTAAQVTKLTERAKIQVLVASDPPNPGLPSPVLVVPAFAWGKHARQEKVITHHEQEGSRPMRVCVLVRSEIQDSEGAQAQLSECFRSFGCWKRRRVGVQIWASRAGSAARHTHLVTPLYMDAPLEKPLLFLQE